LQQPVVFQDQDRTPVIAAHAKGPNQINLTAGGG
jgi:hypothetical protein